MSYAKKWRGKFGMRLTVQACFQEVLNLITYWAISYPDRVLRFLFISNIEDKLFS
jgi:hypothetical protein